MLGALDLEVLRQQTHRGPTAAALDRVAHRATDVEVERIAELVGLGGVIALVTDADPGDLVLTGAIHVELAEQFVERVLAELPDRPRRERETTLRVLGEAGLLEPAGEFGHLFETAGRLVTEELPGAIEIDLRQRSWIGR